MIVLFDVDEVIADFSGLFLDLASRATNRGYRREQVTEWKIEAAIGLPGWAAREVRAELARPGAAHRLQPLPGAIEAVRRIAERHAVYFVTAPLAESETWAHDREEWLRLHFGDELGSRVVHTDHKEVVAGDVFVDDKPANVERWAAAHPEKTAVLWSHPWNSAVVVAGAVRASSWDDLFKLVGVEPSEGPSPTDVASSER